MKGVQVWTVPVSAFYSIKAEGASGGSGVENSGPSKGAMVEAVFHFNTGEQIYLLVGQEGQSACETVPTLGKEYCTGTVTDEERSDLGPQGRSAGGGGGGGGATFVFQINNTSYDAIPLLVAGGGGGLAFSQSPALHDVHGKTAMYPGNGTNGLSSSLSANDVPGSGGGWNDSTPAGPDGKSLLEGGEGGDGCELAYKELRWKTQGGFGGGGGACSSGGGGGGYSGGYAAMRKTLDNNGQGGTSIIHPSAVYSSQEAGQNIGHGSVFIMRVIECHGDEVLSDDRKSCIIPNSEAKLLSIPLTAGIAAGAIFLVVVLILMVSLLVMTMHKKKRQKMQITKFQDMTEYQLAKLRKDAAIDFNPNYELGDGIAKLDDLNEVPREHLELISALGHGAFGEVYEGSFILPDSGEKIKVAVKTLPENSTKQDEIEFLMEALILTKFNHPNIVKCVGVCFLQVPRFIILELMRGGELKDFLREFRPIKEKPSTLKIIDLLYIAMDIAKGCDYLETSRFIHRDIAARNILLTTKEADRVAKIGDFGMARDIYKSDYYRKGGKAMLPVKWMPPEAYLDGIFTSKADVWAFGVLLWEIMSLGYMPYPGMSNQEVMQYVAQGERMHPPRNCPMPVYRIMTQCWQQYPEDRPSFSTIKERLGYCVQDPDVLSTPLPVCPIADDRNKARRPIIRPRNVTSSMHVIDSHEIKNFSQPSTATPSLNSSLNSLSDIRFVPYLDDQLREVDNRKPSEEPCNSSFNSTDVATVNKSLDPEPDSRDSSFNLLNVPAKKNMIDGDSEVSGNEETDLLSPERRNSKNHTSDLPTVNGETDPALESDTHSLSNVSDSSDVDGSPKRKLFCVKKDSGVVMMFDKDASGCQV
ncbi:ALK tyrosine kinase receptor-like [Saccoglossus kowalevskii]